MENNTQQFIDYIKSVIQKCEDADRNTLKEAKIDYKCQLKEGFSGSFDFTYLDGLYGSNKVEGRFNYYDTGLGLFDKFRYETEDFPFHSLSFLTEEVYTKEVVPALTSWLEEKVQTNHSVGYIVPISALHC